MFLIPSPIWSLKSTRPAPFRQVRPDPSKCDTEGEVLTHRNTSIMREQQVRIGKRSKNTCLYLSFQFLYRLLQLLRFKQRCSNDTPFVPFRLIGFLTRSKPPQDDARLPGFFGPLQVLRPVLHSTLQCLGVKGLHLSMRGLWAMWTTRLPRPPPTGSDERHHRGQLGYRVSERCFGR